MMSEKNAILAPEHTQEAKPSKVEKEEKEEKETFSSKVSFSTNSTKVTLNLKGIVSEEAGRFKYLARLLNLKYNDFFSLILKNFCETNPKIIDHLGRQTIEFDIKVKEPPKSYKVRSREADNLMAETRAMLRDGRLSSKSLAYRCDSLLRPFLSNPNLPDEQKEEIRGFIEGESV